jgi:ribosomal-protein-alanine N-acetyltransferase
MTAIELLSGPEIEAGDLDVIERLHAASFEEPWTGEAFQGLFCLSGVFLLCARTPEGNIMGFVLARVAVDEGEILTIAVGPAHRRGRIGQRLMEEAAAEAEGRGARSLFLEVAEDNEPALKLYARLGFSEVGHRANYYARAGGPVGACVMRRTLAKI